MCEFVVLFAYRTNLGIESVLSMQLENSGPKARRKRNTFRKNTLTERFVLLKSKTLKLAQESIDF